MNEKYDVVITALETTTTILTLEFVKSKLLDMELKLKNETTNVNKKDYECSFNVDKRECFICGSTQHFQARCPNNKAANSSKGQGYRGQNYRRGQSNRSRPQYYRGQYPRRERYEKKANLAEETENISFTAMTTEIKSRENNSINFILDSSATNNLVSNNIE